MKVGRIADRQSRIADLLMLYRTRDGMRRFGERGGVSPLVLPRVSE